MKHKDTRMFIEHNNYNCPGGQTSVWVLRQMDKNHLYYRVTASSLRRIHRLGMHPKYQLTVNNITTNGLTVVLQHAWEK